ncbi:MAG: hypothetical protein LBT51_03950 [Fusobacteriaceae bacterium]|jgi:ABC-type phosphate/phosphonate transport system permease subunit|nr:hypothetical protein [Fusobacteriaceae bacterium]
MKTTDDISSLLDKKNNSRKKKKNRLFFTMKFLILIVFFVVEFFIFKNFKEREKSLCNNQDVFSETITSSFKKRENDFYKDDQYVNEFKSRNSAAPAIASGAIERGDMIE